MSAERGQGCKDGTEEMRGGRRTPLQIALEYIARGWNPVPVRYRSKALDVAEGTQLDQWRINEKTAPKHFNRGRQNVGVILGVSSGGLVDVDIDSLLALQLADEILPPTASVFGRKGNPSSHRLYKVDGDPGETEQCQDGEEMLVEYRADGCMTVFPGSLHEGAGEPIEWVSNGDPLVIERSQLLRAVRGLAIATLLTKRWTKGGRNRLAKAVIGVLLRNGAPEEFVKTLICAICRVAGDDEADSRVGMVDKFAGQLAGSPHAKIPGWPALKEATDDCFIANFRKWSGIGDDDTVPGPSDDDLALMFAAKYQDSLRHVAIWARWLVYTGQYWAADEKLRVYDMVRASLRDVRDRLSPTLKPVQQARLRQRLGSASTIYNIVKLAGNDPRLAVAPSELDADPWLLEYAGGDYRFANR